ncbi:hypothetical protein P154DRAFT_575101 [Amniculicola lignicola CBS 123094]|uniref:Uncharacterized protein n=1 Tax=Amniculicola lignicola CBS 123094 TaxID=1392246 RepID=A0A6A5WHK7_9PLEO|nr:hypothetical protein P154DRAFT_575101 [Amniculicola lignicola CBS 123094]
MSINLQNNRKQSEQSFIDLHRLQYEDERYDAPPYWDRRATPQEGANRWRSQPTRGNDYRSRGHAAFSRPDRDTTTSQDEDGYEDEGTSHIPFAYCYTEANPRIVELSSSDEDEPDPAATAADAAESSTASSGNQSVRARTPITYMRTTEDAHEEAADSPFVLATQLESIELSEPAPENEIHSSGPCSEDKLPDDLIMDCGCYIVEGEFIPYIPCPTHSWGTVITETEQFLWDNTPPHSKSDVNTIILYRVELGKRPSALISYLSSDRKRLTESDLFKHHIESIESEARARLMHVG